MDSKCDSHLDSVISEIVDAVRADTFPGLSVYCERYPDLADDLRALTPTLIALEQARTAEAAFTERAAQGVVEPLPVAGHSLGDFQIVREIGRGGMGIVYEAIDPSVPRRVAVKAIAPWMSQNSRPVERFQSEARMIAKLRHPHIVPLLSVGRDQRSLYLVMPLIEGCSLDQVLAELRRRNLPDQPSAESKAEEAPCPSLEAIVRRLTAPAEAGRSSAKAEYFVRIATICSQAASGLQYANAHDVVHRDIKPSNLLLTDELIVCLTDFGMAKSSESANITRTGEIVGTLRYLAPERLRGHCDALSDVYSLGATLYELATLQPPFGEVSDPELVNLISAADPPSPRLIDRQIPRDLETIICKSMAKLPRNRYATAGELAADLLAFAGGLPIQARQPGLWRRATRSLRERARRSPQTARAALALAAGLLMAGALLIGYRSKERASDLPVMATAPAVSTIPMDLTRSVENSGGRSRRRLTVELPAKGNLSSRVFAIVRSE